MSNSSDLAGKLTTARQRLPLQRLMEQRQKTPANGKWKSFPKCPYCGKDGAGLFEREGRQYFKCHHTSCPSVTAGEKGAWDEIGFLAHEHGLSRPAALVMYLKAAGVWEAPATSRATLAREYLPENEGEGDDRDDDTLPPEAQATEPGPPSVTSAEPAPSGTEGPELTSQAKVALVATDGATGVPDLPPVADGVTALPAAPAGMPSPLPGEAAHSPDSSGTLEITDAASPVQSVQTPAEDEPDLDEDEDPERVPLVIRVIRWFFDRLTLTREDRQMLWFLRGLLPRVIEELGLRSSLRSNEQLLWRMGDLFPMNALLNSGLWVRGPNVNDKPRPNRFYYGWGPAGKRKVPGREDEMIFDWTHPILNAYLNRAGEVLDLRTHKWTQKGQSPRLYLPRRLGRPEAIPAATKFAVITEGELKADAIYQGLRSCAIMAALPGITMSKQLWGCVVDWLLEDLPAGGQVAVVFDNEDKGNPELPGYNADWHKRHDSELWARFLEQRLLQEGFAARVGVLPDGWRDAKGKADWDGSLALLMDQLGRQGPPI